MKVIKKALFFAVFTILSHTLFAQTSLCNSVYNFLNLNGCKPVTQSLISTGTNSFPYNISAEFSGKNISADDNFYTPSNLYLIFNQEDIPQNQEILKPLFEYLKQSNFPFNIELVFLYGERQIIEKDGIIYGSQTFLSSLNTNEDSTVIIVNLDKENSSIISTSSGKTAPSWLIKNEHDLFKKEKLSHGLPVYYISQLYSYTFNKVRVLDSFFSYDIPAIILNFSHDIENQSTISNILINSIELFSQTESKNWEQHFLMISLFGHYITVSEINTVKIIVLIIFTFLIFLVLLGFINKTFKQEAWAKIKKIWYVVPITLVLVFAACFTGKGLCILFARYFTPAGKLFFFIGSLFLFSFFYTTIYFWIQIVMDKKLEAQSLDFILILTFFINQFVFSFYDVSLFPIFMIICLLSIVAFWVKNNGIHIVIFILMFLPIGFYVHSLVNTYNSNSLFNYFISTNHTYIFISLLLYPCFLMYLRILEGLKEFFHNKKSFFISGTITLGSAIIIMSIICTIRTKTLDAKFENAKNSVEFITDESEPISISYSDKYVFDDLIRTVNISLSKPCYQFDVRVISNETPILYSSDDYEQVNSNTAYFLIPNNPPQKMSFSYGTNSGSTQINITAIFETNEKEQFSLATKSITIK